MKEWAVLMGAGYLVYHGPREHVLEFFEMQGFECPDRKGVADFLQEVTSRKDQKVCFSFFSAIKFVVMVE